jgi:hypothetical protein
MLVECCLRHQNLTFDVITTATCFVWLGAFELADDLLDAALCACTQVPSNDTL